MHFSGSTMRLPGLLLAVAALLLLAVVRARPSATALGSPLDAALTQGGLLAKDAPLQLPSQPGEILDDDGET